MSIDEMRSFCTSIRPYQLRVHVRLRDGRQVLEGKITDVGTHRFQLQTDDKVINDVNYVWVAAINQARKLASTN